METTKQKKPFKLPHLLYIMLGLVIFMSLLTYVLPAGKFAQDADGKILGDQFAFLGKQTPVNPFAAINYIFTGITNSAMIIAILLASGGNTGVVLETKSMDRVIDWALSRLQNKGVTILVPVMFMLMVLLGAFGGSDALIAVIPVGVMFSKKLKLDPITAAAVTLLATLIGFGTSPTVIMVPQMLMGVTEYSGFGFRVINMIVCGLAGCIFVSRYALKINKNPLKSGMGNADWLEAKVETKELERVPLRIRDIVVVALFLGQYVLMVICRTILGMPMGIMVTIMVPMAIICGIIGGLKADQLGDTFARGVGNMAFVGFIIGLAGTLSLVMNNGNILHTIVYYASLPLRGLSTGLAAIGVSIVVLFINVLIPSASAKAAILIPIIKPLAQTLEINSQIAIQAFQIGDGFTNIISPALGWTVGGLAIAGVPYDKWFKWVIPLIAIILVIEWILLYILTIMGWTGM
jgi:uncharacterized ion transporter superfamily protein YfcC